MINLIGRYFYEGDEWSFEYGTNQRANPQNIESQKRLIAHKFAIRLLSK